MVPSYLSRGPPVLQHPERVVPLSECERFEPHFQPNVALAPIPAPPPVQQPPPPLSLVPPPAAPTVLQPPKRRLAARINRSVSPEDEIKPIAPHAAEPIETAAFAPVSIKLENPSSPCSVEIQATYTPVIGSAVPSTTVDEQLGTSTIILVGDKSLQKEIKEEENSNPAVTSSTVIFIFFSFTI